MTKRKRRRPFGSIFDRPPRPGFYVRFAWQGDRIKRAAGMSRAEAEKKLAATEALLKAGTPLDTVLNEVFGDFSGARLSFRDAAAHYLAYASSRKRESTLHKDAYRMESILTARWTAKHLGHVRTPDLLGWVAERKAGGLSGPSCNRELALVSAVFRWAIRAGYADDNPASRVERDKESRGREVYLAAPECAALLDSCSPALRPLVSAAIHTGMRRGELLSLRWRSVDLERREVRVEAASEKAGRGRTVPLTDALWAILNDLRTDAGLSMQTRAQRVFRRADGRAFTEAALRYQLARAIERCTSLPLEKREALRFHDLRHSAASLMVAAGVPIFDVAKILGHSTLAMTMRYAHFAPEAGRAAVARLGAKLDAALDADKRAQATGS